MRPGSGDEFDVTDSLLNLSPSGANQGIYKITATTFGNRTFTTDISGLVPYTGATGDVDLGQHNLTVGGTIKIGATGHENIIESANRLGIESINFRDSTNTTFMPFAAKGFFSLYDASLLKAGGIMNAAGNAYRIIFSTSDTGSIQMASTARVTWGSDASISSDAVGFSYSTPTADGVTKNLIQVNNGTVGAGNGGQMLFEDSMGIYWRNGVGTTVKAHLTASGGAFYMDNVDVASLVGSATLYIDRIISGYNANFSIGGTGGLNLSSAVGINWSSTTAETGTKDTGLVRSSAGILKVTDGSSGNGSIIALQHNAPSTLPVEMHAGFAITTGDSDKLAFDLLDSGSTKHLLQIAESATRNGYKVDVYLPATIATGGATIWFGPRGDSTIPNIYYSASTMSYTNNKGSQRFIASSTGAQTTFYTIADSPNASGAFNFNCASGSYSTYGGDIAHFDNNATTVVSISSAGLLTAVGVALGANNLTMTGSLAATGARVTKGWFTDLEITNPPTVGGIAMPITASVDRATGQTAAKTLTAYTVGAADASFMVSTNVLVTTSSAEAFGVQCDYTDEGNTARTLYFRFYVSAGNLVATIAFANGAVPYESVPGHIRAKTGTTITISSVGTFTGCTYNIEGIIQKIN